MRLAVAHTIQWDSFLLLDAPHGEAPTLLGELTRHELHGATRRADPTARWGRPLSQLERRCKRLERQLRNAKAVR